MVSGIMCSEHLPTLTSPLCPRYKRSSKWNQNQSLNQVLDIPVLILACKGDPNHPVSTAEALRNLRWFLGFPRPTVGHPHHQPCYFSLQPQHSSPHLWILRRWQTGVAWLHLRVPGKPESMRYYSCGNLKRKRHFAAKIVFLFQPGFLQNNNNLAIWAIAYWSSLVWLSWGVMMWW